MSEDYILNQLSSDSKGLTDSLNKIVDLLTKDPASMPHAWNVIEGIHNTLLPVGYNLIVLFFLIGWLKQTTDFKNISIERTFGMIILLIVSKLVMEQSFDILRAIMTMAHSIVSNINTQVSIPVLDVEHYRSAISGLGFFEKMSFQVSFMFYGMGMKITGLIVQVIIYGVFVELFVLTAMSPIPLAGIANGEMNHMMKRYLQEYTAVALQAAVMMIIVMIYNGFMAEYIVSDDPLGKMMVSSILLAMLLFKSGSYARKITGA